MALQHDCKEILEIADESGAQFPRTAIQNLLTAKFSKVHRLNSNNPQTLKEVAKVLELGSVTFRREALKPIGKVYLNHSHASGKSVSDDVRQESEES